MHIIGILLVVAGGLGLTIAIIGKLLMAWPAANKAAGLALGVAIIGAILWLASPAPGEDKADAEPPTQTGRESPPTFYHPRPAPPPAPPPPPPPVP